MTPYLVELLGLVYRGNEEMEEKGKGSGGRGESTARREGVWSTAKVRDWELGGKGIESVTN